MLLEGKKLFSSVPIRWVRDEGGHKVEDDEDTLIVRVGNGYFETITAYNGIEIMRDGSFLAPHVDNAQSRKIVVASDSNCHYFWRLKFGFTITMRSWNAENDLFALNRL